MKDENFRGVWVGLLALIIIGLFLARDCAAQSVRLDNLTPYLPTATERQVADVASWVTVIADVALDTRASWNAPNRVRSFELQGVRVAATYGAVFAAKLLVFRERPCGWFSLSEGCGIDNPNTSFFSGHTALAFSTIGGPRLAIGLPLAISTGGLRIAAGKHWLTDTLVGAGVGLLTSRIR